MVRGLFDLTAAPRQEPYRRGRVDTGGGCSLLTPGGVHFVDQRQSESHRARGRCFGRIWTSLETIWRTRDARDDAGFVTGLSLLLASGEQIMSAATEAQ